VGAGILGINQLYAADTAGYSARMLEQGGGVGGTWYWNRYPGCRFDSESYTYGYLFSEELWQEWDWSEEFAGQAETERYLNYVVDKFGLRRHIRFDSTVTGAIWDEDSTSWEIRTADRHTRARGLPWRVLPSRPVAQGACGVHGQAGSDHRHRLERRPDRAGDR
jgi:cation diffusion facilitator CzcD-associated flavoprotein CzcO